MDTIIQNWIIEEFKIQSGVNLNMNKSALQRVREAAEKAKIELSSSTSTEISLPYLVMDASGPKHCSLHLTRTQLEAMVDGFLKRTIKPCEICLKDAGIRPHQIDEVLLVGGMTRMPKVQRMVEKIFGKNPNKGVNPDEAVAIGAIVQGGVLMGSVKDIVLIDVTPLSLGTEVFTGIFSKIIPRNTSIPAVVTKMYTTVADGQEAIDFMVLQGEREMGADNKLLGSFRLDGILPSRR